ncbi:hypothetical protein PVAP13_2NG229303 [Panicum virgatum]|uniref:Uncharacterized protein n=1 Tax=Panicum virgatum TaxID=38727 RepID=A0A8T0VCE4_PANVG|nr:hypothetical protein PVAP13_2NG229303 [Panicum virgatum]
MSSRDMSPNLDPTPTAPPHLLRNRIRCSYLPCSWVTATWAPRVQAPHAVPRRPLAAPPCLLLPSRAARSPAPAVQPAVLRPAVQPVAPPQPRRPPSCPCRAARPPVASPLRSPAVRVRHEVLHPRAARDLWSERGGSELGEDDSLEAISC